MDLSDIKTKIYSQNILLNGCDDDNGCGSVAGPMGAQDPFRHIL